MLVVVSVAMEVDVMPRGRGKLEWVGTGGGVSSGTKGRVFFEPKEKVRPARLRKPEPDLEPWGGALSAGRGFLAILASSRICAWLGSADGVADDGVVEAALCRDDVSVDAVFVVLEDPLALDRTKLVRP